jgi:hypothetical protein
MADDLGEDQFHRIIIRKSTKPVATRTDPITPEQKAKFRQQVQDLFEEFQVQADPAQVDRWLDALHPAQDLPVRSDGVM